MRKGISPIIATILLMFIVIASIGFAFGFFQNVFLGYECTKKANITFYEGCGMEYYDTEKERWVCKNYPFIKEICVERVRK